MTVGLPDPEQIQEDLQEILRELGYSPSSLGGYIPVELLEVIMIIVLLVFLLYISFYIVNRSVFSVKESVFGGKREKELIELIEKKDYHTFYRKAVDLGKKAEYLEAVRMLYMALLLLLDSKEIIMYHPSLTNFEYQLKVHSYPFGDLFARVTHTFDIIYYGGKHATGADFSSFVDAFTQIEEAVS